MQARMEVVKGAKTKEICLRLPSVIGRGGEARVKLPASTVSRHHCELYAYEGQLVVRDLGSSNGTIVNGHKIEGPTFLTPEDELTIGPVTVRVSPLEPSNIEQVNDAVGSSDDIAPTFSELPAAETPPSAAAQSDSSVTDLPTDQASDDSVLQYAGPQGPGRSFVAIAPIDSDVELPESLPAVDDSEAETRQTVKPDESALTDFFNSLDDE